jgi:hypothetical protein
MNLLTYKQLLTLTGSQQGGTFSDLIISTSYMVVQPCSGLGQKPSYFFHLQPLCFVRSTTMMVGQVYKHHGWPGLQNHG